MNRRDFHKLFHKYTSDKASQARSNNQVAHMEFLHEFKPLTLKLRLLCHHAMHALKKLLYSFTL